MDTEQRESNLCNEMLDLVDSSSVSINTGMDRREIQTSSENSVSPTSGGFCVKEYELKLDKLEKENFNLKLRLFYLEEKNPNVPNGAEALYKENIDLKVEVESMVKDIQEKQDLLLQAYKAMELYEEEKNSDYENYQKEVHELNERIFLLQSSVEALEQKLMEPKESNGNDTGFTEFLGAVDNKEAENRKLQAEWKENENLLKLQIQKLEREKSDMAVKISELKNVCEKFKEKLAQSDSKMKEQNENIQTIKNIYQEKITELDKSQKQYDFLEKIYSNMKNRFEEFENFQNLDTANLEKELKNFKDKWAESQCDLQDSEAKVKEKKKENEKAFIFIKEKLKELEQANIKICDLENKITEFTSAGASKESAKNLASATLDEYRNKLKNFENEKRSYSNSIKDLEQKSQSNIKQLEEVIKQQESEVMELKVQLSGVKKQLKVQTSQELNQKNLQIEHLSNLMKTLQMGRSSSIGGRPRMSLGKISESFNELQYEQAMLQKKMSQEQIEKLMAELSEIANVKTKEHIAKLQKQIQIVNEKQEVSDSALQKSKEICSVTIDHLKDLAQFLSMLLSQDSLKHSFDESTIDHIQAVLDNTVAFSTRLSMDPGVSFINASSLEVLLSTTRQSIANIREIRTANISMQVSNDDLSKIDEMSSKIEKLEKDLNELNRVNQILEDEIDSLKSCITQKEYELEEKDSCLKSLKNEMNEAIAEHERVETELKEKYYVMEEKLKDETLQRINSTDQAKKFGNKCEFLTKRVETLENDLNENWIPKFNHLQIVQQLKDDIVAFEAQIAAVNMQIEAKSAEIEDLRNTNSSLEVLMKAEKELEDKENFAPVPPPRRTLEISKDRRNLILGDSIKAGSSNTTILKETDGENPKTLLPSDQCPQCPQYKSKVAEYKKWLNLAIGKLKAHTEMRKMQEQLIHGQIQKTECFLHNVASSMESMINAKKE